MVAVQKGAEHLAGMVGAAGGHHPDDVEDLKGADDGDRDQDQGRLADAGDGDVEELLPGVGAVEPGRLVEFPRHRADGDDEEDHRVAEPLPLGDGGDREQGGPLFAEPGAAQIPEADAR